MARSYKILAQSNPVALTLTDIYTVPSTTNTTISTIVVANRSSTSTSFRISIANGGAVDSPEQYIYYDINIPGNETFAATLGITLNAGDVLRVYAKDATLSFNVFGVEIS